MMLFHSSCDRWDKSTGPVPRLKLVPQTEADAALCTRTYTCERCHDQIHIDMNWPEGAKVEREATVA